jgi:hypothetical protein
MDGKAFGRKGWVAMMFLLTAPKTGTELLCIRGSLVPSKRGDTGFIVFTQLTPAWSRIGLLKVEEKHEIGWLVFYGFLR